MDWWDDPQKEITKLLGVLKMRKKEKSNRKEAKWEKKRKTEMEKQKEMQSL